jgi:A/G-specific adenine glycosylase
VEARSRERFVPKLMGWARRNTRAFPWRETTDPFRVLVSEVLLQRSRGSTVARVYEDLFDRWPTADRLAAASEESIASVVRQLGLARRARTLRNLAEEVDRRGGVPASIAELQGLPGVGRYAASATLAVAFGIRAPVVDGVTARVYRRYFGSSANTPASTDPGLWTLVEEVTPTKHVKEWNWAVLDLAATICLPKVPRCGECPLQADCAWSQASIDPVGGAC